MLDNAKWIWIDGEKNPRNKWVLFKRIFNVYEECLEAILRISADSRYILYFNGIRIHKGPNRAFPESYQFDTIDVKSFLNNDENCIEVLVNHVGMSTHQYILGQAALIAGLDIQYINTRTSIYTDELWTCTEDCGFIKENIRISAGQGYSELYNADIKQQKWHNAKLVGEYGVKPWGSLTESILPLPISDKISAKCVLEANEVNLNGKLVNVDIHPIFIGEIQEPEFFYLVTDIVATKPIKCKVTFPYSRLWCCYGEFIINGREYALDMRDFVFEPVAAGSKSYEVELDAGSNIFAMQLGDIAMGMHVGMFFDCNSDDIDFVSPFDNKYSFSAVTSLLNADSHIIKLDEGDWINHPRNHEINNSEKEIAAIECWEILKSRNLTTSNNISKWVREIDNTSVSSSHPQHSILMQKKVKSIHVNHNIENLILDNNASSIIEGGSDKSFLIDFGLEVSGYIHFEITDAKEGEVLDFSGFEYRDRYGKNQEMDGVNNGFRYITKKGKQSFTSHISRAFRYLNVTTRNKALLKIRYIGIVQSHFPVTQIGQFQCDDYKLNKIYEISERTTRLCMMDTFVDCAGHEQSFWIGDFRNEALISLYLYNSEKIVENCHRVALGELNTNILPKASTPSAPQGITPTWTLLWLMSFWELVLYRGYYNITDYFDGIKKCVDVFVSRIKENGLISVEWNDMLDWAPLDISANKYQTNVNAETYLVLIQFIKISEYLNLNEIAERYYNIAIKLKENIIEKLWSPLKSAFADSMDEYGQLSDKFSVQINSMVYLCGCVNEAQEKVLNNYLVYGFPEDFQKINSPFASFFYYEALEKAEKKEVIIKDILNKWGQMLDLGATTCFETFPGWEKEIITRSHCHAWSAAPCYFIPRNILGIRPLKEGFKVAEIKPELGSLMWAYGVVPVIGGSITVFVRRENDITKVYVRKPREISIRISEKFIYEVEEF